MLGDEELVAIRVKHDADLHAPVRLEADRHAEDRQAVGVVGRAVERVDDPAPARAPTPGAALLGEDPVLRECGEQARDDQLLGARVHLGHEVGGAALVRDVPRSLELALEEVTGRARGVDRHAPFERR